MFRKKKWSDHINRMENNKNVKIVKHWVLAGKRSLGTPKMRWEDTITGWIQKAFYCIKKSKKNVNR